jgi:type IV secretion system protein VirD4
MMKQSNLPYVTPEQPGFLGTYNWRTVLFCIFLITASSSAGTQYIASHFGFQAALGQALYRSDSYVIYEPFHWALWVFRYLNSTNPTITTPIIKGGAIAIVGASASIFVSILIGIQRNKRLSEGTEALHGSARFAEPKEILDSDLARSKEGVYVGGWHDKKKGYLHYLRDDSKSHTLIFAPTRSGKGVGVVIPTLLGWNHSAVIYDIKGENWHFTSGFRFSAGQICFKFAPVDPYTSARFNPLNEIRIFTQYDVADAQNLADIMARSNPDAKDPYWQDAAASITTGMVLHVCYAARALGREPTFAELAGTFIRPGQSFKDTLAELINYTHDPEGAQGWQTPEGVPTKTHPIVRLKAQEFLDKADKDASGVLSQVNTALSLFSDPVVALNTSSSDFRISDLIHNEQPISVYLVVPPSDKLRLKPLIRLIFTMIVNRLTSKMEFETASKPKNRLLFLIDEFPSLGRLEIFADALSYMAGYGMKALLITQDVTQIVDQYGQNESIVSNCLIRAAYAPNKFETAKLLSDMTGIATVSKASMSYSGSRISPMMGHVNASLDQVQRPLMTPDEIMRLKPPQRDPDGNIVFPGDMLIFESGRFPIYGTQILYFSDKELLRRSKIKPPEALYQILDGRVLNRPATVCGAGVPANPRGDSVAMDVVEEPRNNALPSHYLEELEEITHTEDESCR